MGFDIMIDNNFKAWLLEINRNPSMNIMMPNQITAPINGDQKMVSEIDKYLKVKVVGDAFNLMLENRGKNKESRN